MTPERWKKLDEIVQRALEMKVDDRSAYLDSECRGDPILRREVESLIAYQQDVSRFLEQPAVKDAALLMANASAVSLEGRSISHYKLARKIGEGAWDRFILPTTPRSTCRWQSSLSPLTQPKTRPRESALCVKPAPRPSRSRKHLLCGRCSRTSGVLPDGLRLELGECQKGI